MPGRSGGASSRGICRFRIGEPSIGGSQKIRGTLITTRCSGAKFTKAVSPTARTRLARTLGTLGLVSRSLRSLRLYITNPKTVLVSSPIAPAPVDRRQRYCRYRTSDGDTADRKKWRREACRKYKGDVGAAVQKLRVHVVLRHPVAWLIRTT